MLFLDHGWDPHESQFPVPTRTLEEEMDEITEGFEIGVVNFSHREDYFNSNTLFSISSISRKKSLIRERRLRPYKWNEGLEDLS